MRVLCGAGIGLVPAADVALLGELAARRLFRAGGDTDGTEAGRIDRAPEHCLTGADVPVRGHRRGRGRLPGRRGGWTRYA